MRSPTKMGVDAELPRGGIVHVHFEKDGRSHGVDVWDSVEAYRQFVQSTLVPAMGMVADGALLVDLLDRLLRRGVCGAARKARGAVCTKQLDRFHRNTRLAWVFGLIPGVSI